MGDKNKIKISAFRAVEHPSFCEEFMVGHSNVLRDIDINVNKLTSANSVWSKSTESTVIIARCIESGQLVGGVRVDIGGGSFPLPIEKAIGKLDQKIYGLVKHHAANGGTGELCGLWISSKVAGMGVSGLLIKAGISITNQLKLNTLLILCSEATLQLMLKMGCIINTSVGNNGTFYYPKEDLIATALLIPDLKTLETANEIYRERIFNLRTKPNQKRIIFGTMGKMEIDYELII